MRVLEWDYYTDHLPGIGTEAALKRIGLAGWELVLMTSADPEGDVWAVFKRPRAWEDWSENPPTPYQDIKR